MVLGLQADIFDSEFVDQPMRIKQWDRGFRALLRDRTRPCEGVTCNWSEGDDSLHLNKQL